MDACGVFEVSVPFRGFRGLQACEPANPKKIKKGKFQSPSGVLGVCRGNRTPLDAAGVFEWFQSPSGVLGVCRSPGVPACTT